MHCTKHKSHAIGALGNDGVKQINQGSGTLFKEVATAEMS